MRAGARKQAMVPVGATVLEPVGTAPGLLVGASPLVAVLPGPPRELQTMWADAVTASPLSELLARAGTLEQRILRFFPLPEPQIAATLRELGEVPFEVTTCLRRGELEVATVFAPSGRRRVRGVRGALRSRHGDVLFSDDGATIDEVIARMLAGRTIATAESCTGGLMAGRLTDLAGSSAYVLGGLVVYSNEAKIALAGVPAALIEAHGAVSPEVATALSRGRSVRLGRRHRDRHHGHRRPGRERRRPSRSAPSASRSRPRTTPRSAPSSSRGPRADVRDRTTTVTPAHAARAAPAGMTPERRGDAPPPGASHRASPPRAAPERAADPAASPAERPLRLFVALDLPADVRAALAAVGAAADRETWRALAAETLHVTLAFLGARPATDVATIEPLVAALDGRPAPRLALKRVLGLPPRRARVLTVELRRSPTARSPRSRPSSRVSSPRPASSPPRRDRSARTSPSPGCARGCAPPATSPRSHPLAFDAPSVTPLPLPDAPCRRALRGPRAREARLTLRSPADASTGSSHRAARRGRAQRASERRQRRARLRLVRRLRRRQLRDAERSAGPHGRQSEADQPPHRPRRQDLGQDADVPLRRPRRCRLRRDAQRAAELPVPDRQLPPDRLRPARHGPLRPAALRRAREGPAAAATPVPPRRARSRSGSTAGTTRRRTRWRTWRPSGPSSPSTS